MNLEQRVFLPPETVLNRLKARAGVPLALLTGKERTSRVSGVRHEAMWLLRSLTTADLTQIGAMLGGRSPATVGEGIGRVAERAAREPIYAKSLADLREFIAADDDDVLITPWGQNNSRLTAAAGVLADPKLCDADARRAALILLNAAGHGEVKGHPVADNHTVDATVDCPVLGQLPMPDCQSWRDKARNFQGHNTRRVQMNRACRRCPHFLAEDSE